MKRISLLKSLFNANVNRNKSIIKNGKKYVSISETMQPHLKETLTEARTTLGNYGEHKGLKMKFQPLENDIFDGVRMDVEKIRTIIRDSNDSVPILETLFSPAGMAVIDAKGKDKSSFLREVYEALSNINRRIVNEEQKEFEQIRAYLKKHPPMPR